MLNDEAGSTSLAVIGAVGLVLVLALWLTALGVVMRARLDATTAADAAALAAAPVTFLPFGAKGAAASEAARFAELNGTQLVWCECPLDQSFDSRTVEVRVVKSVHIPILGLTRIEATGRAVFAPALLLAGADG